MNKILIRGEVYLNCYIIKEAGECYLINPGCEKEKIRQYLEEHQLNVLGILLTDAHPENIRALDVANVPIYMHRKEFEIFTDSYNHEIKPMGPAAPFRMDDLRIILIRDKDTFYINENRIHTIHTPGHTQGSVCFRYRDDLYTGDTLYQGRVGRWDLPTGSLADMRKTIVHLIEEQPEHVRIHPSRGGSSTIGDEKKSNYFYLEWKDMVHGG